MNKNLTLSNAPAPGALQAPRRRSALPAISLGLLASAAAGCTAISYSNPAGERFSRVAIGSNTAVTALEIDSATNGLRQVRLRGYRHDSAHAMGSITEAAVRAALQSR